MTEQNMPADWAIERALVLSSWKMPLGIEHFKKQIEQGQWTTVTAFARYIEAHEEPPVDPLLIEARELVAAWFVSNPMRSHDPDEYRAGKCDERPEVVHALTALRRGIELAGEVK